MSKASKALICKAFAALQASSQQSYPQFFWMNIPAIQNQGLSRFSYTQRNTKIN